MGARRLARRQLRRDDPLCLRGELCCCPGGQYCLFHLVREHLRALSNQRHLAPQYIHELRQIRNADIRETLAHSRLASARSQLDLEARSGVVHRRSKVEHRETPAIGVADENASTARSPYSLGLARRSPMSGVGLARQRGPQPTRMADGPPGPELERCP